METKGSRELAAILGESESIRSLRERITKIGPTRVFAFIIGETGTGKELVARAIAAGGLRPGPFVPINLAAVPDQIIESTLFGHKRGSFSGASADKSGLFIQADGGVLFLDEVGAASHDLQVKILRAIETGEVRPLGTLKPVRFSARVIAATNNAKGLLPDLYFRLAKATVYVPALRDRPGDVEVLVRSLTPPLCEKNGVEPPVDFSTTALDLLRKHDWPGNVRQLQNVVVQLGLECPGARVRSTHARDVLRSHDAVTAIPVVSTVKPAAHDAGHGAGQSKSEGAAGPELPASLPATQPAAHDAGENADSAQSQPQATTHLTPSRPAAHPAAHFLEQPGRERRLDRDDLRIVVEVRHRDQLTRPDVEQLLGISRATAGRRLKRLVAHGFLAFETVKGGRQGGQATVYRLPAESRDALAG